MRSSSTQANTPPNALIALRAELAQAQTDPWRASLFMSRIAGLRDRFERCCCELMDLRRQLRRRLTKIWAMSLPLAALLLALAGGSAEAATMTIGVGGCNTIVDAIDAANSGGTVNGCTGSAGADTIVLSGGTYTYTAVNNSSGGDNGLPLVTTDITIEGNGATIERDMAAVATFRLINVSNTGTLTLKDAVVQGGVADDAGFGYYGGGIRSSGELNLDNVTIQGNSARRGGGVAMTFGAATATISNTTIESNTAGATGGGILGRDASMTLDVSTVRGNRAALESGGIHNANGTLIVDRSTINHNIGDSQCGAISNVATAVITNSTISGNTAPGGNLCGFNESTTTLINSTITGNSATSANPGIRLYQNSSVTMSNSIITGQLGGANCLIGGGTSITSGGNNLASDATCNLTMGTDKPSNPNANLGPLQDNGGPTETHALSWGSDALDMGSDAICAAAPVNAVDQRNIGRPQPAGGTCDIGAFEARWYQLEVQRTGSGTGQVNSSPSGITCSGSMGDCEESYPEGTVVALSPNANIASEFAGWDPASDPDCQDGQVQMDADKLCIAIFNRLPTAVSVARFETQVDPSGHVVVAWETASESDLAGFHLERAAEPEGPYARVNARLIPARGSAATGAIYRLTDQPGVGTHHYRLEAVNRAEAPQRFGPRSVIVRALRLFLPWTATTHS